MKAPTPVKSFFDIVNVILEKKPYPTDEDIQKHCNQYMCNSLLSCDIQLVDIAHEMSKKKLTNRMYFDCLYNGIPKCKKFIKWNASKAKKEQDIQYLMEYFGVSQTIAKSHVQLIEETELQEIRDFYEKVGVIK